ncbi:hypothetical protein DPMN_048852 [Dreissena polymorpha]|uniref:Uncharacterized protein n=1 Tax=Dreissena polymorpha TaxID=45954 RepID=A0A9D4I3A3_DREPO|nr:hypothetical protein DPMN_048852 [Dreissena polymorpha]
MAKKEVPLTLDHCQVKDCQLHAVFCECYSHKHSWGKKHKDWFDERTFSSYWMRNTISTKPTTETPSP